MHALTARLAGVLKHTAFAFFSENDIPIGVEAANLFSNSAVQVLNEQVLKAHPDTQGEGVDSSADLSSVKGASSQDHVGYDPVGLDGSAPSVFNAASSGSVLARIPDTSSSMTPLPRRKSPRSIVTHDSICPAYDQRPIKGKGKPGALTSSASNISSPCASEFVCVPVIIIPARKRQISQDLETTTAEEATPPKRARDSKLALDEKAPVVKDDCCIPRSKKRSSTRAGLARRRSSTLGPQGIRPQRLSQRLRHRTAPPSIRSVAPIPVSPVLATAAPLPQVPSTILEKPTAHPPTLTPARRPPSPPFNHFAHLPRPRPRGLRREHAFYHRSHYENAWVPEFGPYDAPPKTVQEAMPEWLQTPRKRAHEEAQEEVDERGPSLKRVKLTV
ncbi:hypothetical protein H0H81_003050 [Sphagnurus paluster]|uniref:Uncharacterized protein n=1 Tax=Sphagnurus paluster TaxID=117069 RepID=A0A9P7GME1_9AGAR|nr:hypothetical protein H0H81_003050 [Sphagnurus paluster]